MGARQKMTTVRKAAVSGKFYPGNALALREAVRDLLAASELPNTCPKGIIVPHAGFVYSGPIAASGYSQLSQLAETVRIVVLLGPAHRFPVRGLAACDADFFETPLGQIPIDTDSVAAVLELSQVNVVNEAHKHEHSLEVHLPFLQVTFPNFRLVPLLVGEASAEEVAEVIDLLWGGPETLFVVSSDLSHFHDYQTATELDFETSRQIEQLRYQELRSDRACGFRPISGLLSVANKRGLRVKIIDVRNSGDISGERDRVVGYGAYVVE